MKRGGAFTLPFAMSPRFKSMVYPIFDTEGNKVGSFTAADVLTWRASTTQSSVGRRLFSTPGAGMKRDEFQSFLRVSFKRLLGGGDEMTALVSAITPHSFRAGMASDLQRCGVRVKTIMKWGRWESERAMKQYVRDGLAQRLSSARFSSVRRSAIEIASLVRSS